MQSSWAFRKVLAWIQRMQLCILSLSWQYCRASVVFPMPPSPHIAAYRALPVFSSNVCCSFMISFFLPLNLGLGAKGQLVAIRLDLVCCCPI